MTFQASPGCPRSAGRACERLLGVLTLVWALTASPAVLAATGLSASSASAPAIVDLTALGSTDWVHWAFDQTSDINRKTGGGALLGNYALGGGAIVLRRTTASGYVWSDGTPQSQVPLVRRKGLRNTVIGGSFRLTVPATPEPATLRLFVGARNAAATLTATLSDGSVTPVSLNISAGSSRITEQAEFVFAADAPGTSLEVTYILDSASGSSPEQFLEAAALDAVSVPGNQPPVLETLANVTLTEGETLTLNLLASDPDDPTGLEFFQTNSLPGAAAQLTDNGDGTGSIVWNSSVGDAAGSPFSVDVVVVDPAGAQDSQTVLITVLPEGAAADALLAGSFVVTTAPVDLTAAGTDDWAHWGFSSGAPFISKAPGSGAISDLNPIGNSLVSRFAGNVAKHTWSDGAPIASAVDNTTALRVRSIGAGMTFDVAADTQLRKLRVYVGARRAQGRLIATLSDGSAPPVTVDVVSQPGKQSFTITLDYRAASPDATLQVSYEFESQPIAGVGWVSLESAALSVAPNFTLPFADGFANGAADWQVVDEALDVSSSWVAQNNRYEQLNFMGFTTRAMQGAAHVGTLSYLQGASALTDYRFSVLMQPVVGASQGFSQDIGALVRYNPATGDQIRLSFSGANAFGRLEQRVGGNTKTLAQNSIGLSDTSARAIEISVQGPAIIARLNGQKLFAAFDAGVSEGTIGLYCRNACAFDDVEIDAVQPGPVIAVVTPTADSVQAGSTFSVSAVVHNPVVGGTVEFDVPGQTSSCSAATETAPGFFEASCSVSGTGVYNLEAVYLDSEAVQLDSDTRTNVGVGDYYIALGNSITAGLDDSTASDAISANGLVVGTQGFAAMLSDRLSNVIKPVLVTNNGVPGDTSTEILNERIEGVLERHRNASHLLLTVGVNEAGGGTFLPSGLGCIGAACEGTYKGNVQGIVDAINPPGGGAPGIEVVVSLAPPRFGDPFQAPYDNPATHPRNQLIRDEYNEVIANELTGAAVGPDLFRLFLGPENRFYLYQTNLHPNALGYHLMAAEFEAALTGSSSAEFYATQLCLRLTATSDCQKPLQYKQNLMEPGSLLYIDDDRRLTGTLPAALADGRWIQTAHGDRNRSNANYLEFEVPQNATLYVAYDADATSLPGWLTSGFSATPMSITTSGASGAELTLYVQNNVLGQVVLGGAAANQHNAAVNYLAILVED